MATVKFFASTLEQYNQLEGKDANSLYVIEDAGRIYKGDKNVTGDTSLVTSVPDTLQADKVAIVKVDASGQTMYDIYVGDSSNAPVKVQPGDVSDSSDFDNEGIFGSYTATVSAIKTFVKKAVQTATSGSSKAFIDASFANGTLTFTPADSSGNKTVELTNVAHGIQWDSSQFKLTIPQYGVEEDVVINIPKDFFLQSGEYIEDHEFTPDGEGDTYHSPAIHLVVNVKGGEAGTKQDIYIPVKDLVDTYTVASTDTVTLTLSPQHEISAQVKFDTATVQSGDEHILVKTATGIAETTKSLNDIAGDITSAVNAAKSEINANLPGAGEADKVIISTANGMTRSTAGIGGATLNGTPNATTLATEAAVSTAINTCIETALTWNTIA